LQKKRGTEGTYFERLKPSTAIKQTVLGLAFFFFLRKKKKGASTQARPCVAGKLILLYPMSQRLKKQYLDTIVPNLTALYKYSNKHQVPKMEKIVINRGIGDASQNQKMVEASLKEIAVIAGQKGVITRTKKAIAGFKVREKMPVGVVVTLRGERMYSFLDRLIHLALPRVRDFQGMNPKSFDKRGNYSLGLEEQLMFPEIEYSQIDQIRGIGISLVTTAKKPEEGLALLKDFGLPFAGPSGLPAQ
jgi:large subunit ribosomal protein L5